jgi:hypothetical protein
MELFKLLADLFGWNFVEQGALCATETVACKVAPEYVSKFWDAGNLVIALIVGLAFVVYYYVARSQETRRLLYKYNLILIVLSCLGNALVFYLVARIGFHEVRTLVSIVGESSLMVNSAESAVDMRLYVVIANFVICLAALLFVRIKYISLPGAAL